MANTYTYIMYISYYIHIFNVTLKNINFTRQLSTSITMIFVSIYFDRHYFNILSDIVPKINFMYILEGLPFI